MWKVVISQKSTFLCAPKIFLFLPVPFVVALAANVVAGYLQRLIGREIQFGVICRIDDVYLEQTIVCLPLVIQIRDLEWILLAVSILTLTLRKSSCRREYFGSGMRNK